MITAEETRPASPIIYQMLDASDKKVRRAAIFENVEWPEKQRS